MIGDHPAGRGLNSEKGKNVKRFLSWRLKPGEFWAKRDEIAGRSSKKEDDASAVLANNAEDAVIMLFIYIYGLTRGRDGFTEEDLQHEMEKMKNFDEMTIRMIDWIREISNNDQR